MVDRAPLLDVRGLSKRFGGLQAVRDLSFALGEGEIVSLIGPNGAGKTTVFGLLSGFHVPDEGDIRLRGRSLVGLEPHAICALGLARTFQIVRPFPRLTVLANVEVGALAREPRRPEAQVRARAVLEYVGLAAKVDQPAGSLTLAERKRLELARALATGPSLLLLDEVMAGLNASETERIVELIRGINRSGVTILLIEHVMRAVMSLSERVIAINYGETLAQGRPGEVANDPRVIEAYLGEPVRPVSTLLRLEGLEVAYGDMVAVHDVSLEIASGEFVALVGSNGAGKTTTLRAATGLLRPRQGRIELDGERIDGLSPADIVRRGIAHVPEGRQLFPTMTVRENLELGARTAESRARRAETLDRVCALFPRLAERHAQLAGTLSGGEQQMCAIGRGLMSRPRLLLLDEPSLGLAPLMVRLIFDNLRRINAEGTTILLVEQNVRKALELSTRAYVLENGRIVLSGPRAVLVQSDAIRQAYLGL